MRAWYAMWCDRFDDARRHPHEVDAYVSFVQTHRDSTPPDPTFPEYLIGFVSSYLRARFEMGLIGLLLSFQQTLGLVVLTCIVVSEIAEPS